MLVAVLTPNFIISHFFRAQVFSPDLVGTVFPLGLTSLELLSNLAEWGLVSFGNDVYSFKFRFMSLMEGMTLGFVLFAAGAHSGATVLWPFGSDGATELGNLLFLLAAQLAVEVLTQLGHGR